MAPMTDLRTPRPAPQMATRLRDALRVGDAATTTTGPEAAANVEEEKALRDGYNLFGKKDGSGKKDEWIKKTMEKFAFHPSHRTVKSLKQKWQKLNK